MKLYLSALALALTPALANGYGIVPRLFADPMVVYTPGAMMRRTRALMDQALPQRSSPRYEITDTDEKFQLAVDVPGVKASDINVRIEDNMLSVYGERKEEKENYSFASKFHQSFSLSPEIVPDKFEAELKNGVLYVTAPKDLKRLEENVQKIPVIQASDDETVKMENVKEAPKSKTEEKVEDMLTA